MTGARIVGLCAAAVLLWLHGYVTCALLRNASDRDGRRRP